MNKLVRHFSICIFLCLGISPIFTFGQKNSQGSVYQEKTDHQWKLAWQAPLLKPGLQISRMFYLKTKVNKHPSGRIYKYMGLRDDLHLKTRKTHWILESYTWAYNRRFSHLATGIGLSLQNRVDLSWKTNFGIGLSLARRIEIMRDVMVADERGNFEQRNFASDAMWELGAVLNTSFRLYKNQLLQVGYHPGIQFPFNHALGLYQRFEIAWIW